MNFIDTLEADEELEQLVKAVSNKIINRIQRQNWKENATPT